MSGFTRRTVAPGVEVVARDGEPVGMIVYQEPGSPGHVPTYPKDMATYVAYRYDPDAPDGRGERLGQRNLSASAFQLVKTGVGTVAGDATPAGKVIGR